MLKSIKFLYVQSNLKTVFLSIFEQLNFSQLIHQKQCRDLS